MFSDEDVKEIYQNFAPPTDSFTLAPRLIAASDGSGFLTLQHLEAELKARVTQGARRLSITSLARDINVDPDIVRRFVITHLDIALLNNTESDVVTLDERNALRDGIEHDLTEGVILKSDLAINYDLSIKSVDALLCSLGTKAVYHNDFVCSQSYEDQLSHSILNCITVSLEKLEPATIVPADLPGSPPIWHTFRILTKLLGSQNLANKFHIHEESNKIVCSPKQLTEQRRNALVNDLQSGALAFVSLQKFWKDFPELFPTLHDAQKLAESLPAVDILDAFAISRVWISRLGKECAQTLQQDGCVELTNHVNTFPESLQSRILQDIQQTVFSSFTTTSELKPHRVGSFLLTSGHYDKEINVLVDLAKADALAQWRQLKDDPTKDVKFNLANITAAIPSENNLQSSLIKERSVEKALDEQFSKTLSEQEQQNEVEFSAFWVERVVPRSHIYNEALNTIDDSKLRDQLADLLASYLRRELIPDSITKARSQLLVLSRKTRRNISKFEGIIKSSNLDTTGLLAALTTFSKKQGIEVPDTARLADVKKALVNDLVRRMQKQKQKQSDGPLLFLTLVLIVFAKIHAGVVYATGKFAPKLLKQLKSALGPEQYELLEKWKEGAKAGALSAEDRQEMKTMAEAMSG